MFGLGDPLIGIDIGSDSIKIIDFKSEKSKKIRKIFIEKLPRGVIENGDVKSSEKLTTIIKEKMKTLGLWQFAREVAISLAGNAVIIKTIIMDNIDDFELHDLIESEAEQHFQIELDQLYFTWHIQRINPDSDKVIVVLVGAKKEVINELIKVMKDAGLGTHVVDCDVFATANALSNSYGDHEDLRLILNIGKTGTQFSLITDGSFIYSREIPIGGDVYTEALSEILDVDFIRAEDIKINLKLSDEDGLQDEKILDVFRNVNQALLNEVRFNLDSYFNSENNLLNFKKIDRVFVVGGGAMSHGLIDALKEGLDVQTEILDPFINHQFPSNVSIEEIRKNMCFYGVALGLASREKS